MSEIAYKYIWRCVKCGSHFVNIHKADGVLKQEKKCSKCKSVNTITLTDKEIYIHCRFYDPQNSGYQEESSETYSYPVIGS
ncbi:hypothetical protein KAR28_02675 [Candidatus Parcubacteria bacterium]|nr:hypothetical protein [Candidatus Parcubacteria bacterium]